MKEEFESEPLSLPVVVGGKRPDVLLADKIAASAGRCQEQQTLLDIGSQLQQVHDLGDAGPRHAPEPSEFSVIEILASDGRFKLNREGHQTANARHWRRRTLAGLLLVFV